MQAMDAEEQATLNLTPEQRARLIDMLHLLVYGATAIPRKPITPQTPTRGRLLAMPRSA